MANYWWTGASDGNLLNTANYLDPNTSEPPISLPATGDTVFDSTGAGNPTSGVSFADFNLNNTSPSGCTFFGAFALGDDLSADGCTFNGNTTIYDRCTVGQTTPCTFNGPLTVQSDTVLINCEYNCPSITIGGTTYTPAPPAQIGNAVAVAIAAALNAAIPSSPPPTAGSPNALLQQVAAAPNATITGQPAAESPNAMLQQMAAQVPAIIPASALPLTISGLPDAYAAFNTTYYPTAFIVNNRPCWVNIYFSCFIHSNASGNWFLSGGPFVENVGWETAVPRGVPYGLTFDPLNGITDVSAVASQAQSDVAQSFTASDRQNLANVCMATNTGHAPGTAGGLGVLDSSGLAPETPHTAGNLTSAPPSPSAISAQVASDLATAHGDGSWQTATGFATASDVNTAAGNVITHGDGNWRTASGFATSSDWTADRAARLDNLDAAITTRLGTSAYTPPAAADEVAAAILTRDVTSLAAVAAPHSLCMEILVTTAQAPVATGTAQSGVAADVTEIARIAQIKTQTLALIAQITANPKPSYKIDGQDVLWTEYLAQLQKTVQWCDRQAAAAAPLEVQSQAYT
ncbi:MAG: hypothetical protein ABSG68_05410 [Thermoguttaceae bacterium]